DLASQFSTASPEIDEKAIRDADPREMCAAIARAKAAELAGRVDERAILVTADQVFAAAITGDVARDGEGEQIREKPENAQEAKHFLRSYSGRTVKTVNALCVTNLETGQAAEGLHQSTVSWKKIPSDVIDAVVARGLVMSSAGGFSLEDPDLGPLLDNIDGSVDSIFGLPVDLLCTLIGRITVDAV
ncbi:unnamed protein product, partial [Hapterophycus canaliculatus]